MFILGCLNDHVSIVDRDGHANPKITVKKSRSELAYKSNAGLRQIRKIQGRWNSDEDK